MFVSKTLFNEFNTFILQGCNTLYKVNKSRVTVNNLILLQKSIFQINSVLLKFLFIKECFQSCFSLILIRNVSGTPNQHI